MSEHLDDRARRAGAAVHARTAHLGADRGLDAVVRRGRRPRPGTALAVVLVIALAVPALGWIRGLDGAGVELEPPAAAPATEPTPGEEEPLPPEGEPTPSGGPAEEPTATEEPPDEPAPEETADPATQEPAPPAGPEPLGAFGTAEVTAGDFPFGGGEVALLTDVRVGGHQGFDRVVLELDGPAMPSYRVGYVDPPIIQDGSGDEVAVDGEAFLELRLAPASGFDATGTTWEPTYEGPLRVSGDTAVVTEVVRTGDFEAHLAWVVGLGAEQPFSVTVLGDPLRLVIDIRTG